MGKFRNLAVKIQRKFIFIFGDILNLNACIVIGFSDDGNAILKLKKSTALGKKGDLIELPRDKVIFEYVRRFGHWSIETSDFLAHSINKLNTPMANTTKTIALIDLGANCGLVSLQIYNTIKSSIHFIFVEPLSNHLVCLKSNFSKYIHEENLTFFNFALGERTEKKVIFMDKLNVGNSSLLESVIPKSTVSRFEIDVKNAYDFFEEKLPLFDRLIVKSDIQGFDALVLASLSGNLWNRVDAAVIEVWALPEIRIEDVLKLSERMKSFDLGWSAESIGKITLDEVKNFWLCKNGDQRDLFIRRVMSQVSI